MFLSYHSFLLQSRISMQSSFFVPFIFNETTLSQLSISSSSLTVKEQEIEKRKILSHILRESHHIQTQIHLYAKETQHHRLYVTPQIEPHYEQWIEEHIRLLQYYLQTQYPNDVEPVSDAKQLLERNQRAIHALSLLLQRIRSDNEILQQAFQFATYDHPHDPFAGGLCQFL